jgi:hypothetical protein
MIFSFIFVCFRTSFGYFFQFDLHAGRLRREFIRRCVLRKTSIINLTVCFELILKIKLENVKWLSSQRNLDEISSKLTYSGQASCRRERDWVRKPVSLSLVPFLFLEAAHFYSRASICCTLSSQGSSINDVTYLGGEG